MVRGTINFGVVLHEEVFLNNSPPSLCNIFVRLRILLRHILPTEKSSILTDGVDLQKLLACWNSVHMKIYARVYLFLLRIKVGGNHTLAMPCQGSWLKAIFRV